MALNLKEKKYAFISLLAIFFLLFIAFYTRSRGPLLAIILTIIWQYSLPLDAREIDEKYSYKRYKKRKYIIISFLILSLLVVAIWIIIRINTDVRFRSFSYRLSLINSMLPENWMPLFGIGYGNFVTINEIAARFKYPHNIIVEVFSELGLIGLTFLIFIIIITIKSC